MRGLIVLFCVVTCLIALSDCQTFTAANLLSKIEKLLSIIIKPQDSSPAPVTQNDTPSMTDKLPSSDSLEFLKSLNPFKLANSMKFAQILGSFGGLL